MSKLGFYQEKKPTCEGSRVNIFSNNSRALRSKLHRKNYPKYIQPFQLQFKSKIFNSKVSMDCSQLSEKLPKTPLHLPTWFELVVPRHSRNSRPVNLIRRSTKLIDFVQLLRLQLIATNISNLYLQSSSGIIQFSQYELRFIQTGKIWKRICEKGMGTS